MKDVNCGAKAGLRSGSWEVIRPMIMHLAVASAYIGGGFAIGVFAFSETDNPEYMEKIGFSVKYYTITVALTCAILVVLSRVLMRESLAAKVRSEDPEKPTEYEKYLLKPKVSSVLALYGTLSFLAIVWLGFYLQIGAIFPSSCITLFVTGLLALWWGMEVFPVVFDD